jgi:hypothetical protein
MAASTRVREKGGIQSQGIHFPAKASAIAWMASALPDFFGF